MWHSETPSSRETHRETQRDTERYRERETERRREGEASTGDDNRSEQEREEGLGHQAILVSK